MDGFINRIGNREDSINDVDTILCFLYVEASTAGDEFFLMIDVNLQCLPPI